MGLVPGVFTDSNIHDKTLHELSPLAHNNNDLINVRTEELVSFQGHHVGNVKSECFTVLSLTFQ
jgi:hypothetical protein